MAQTWLRTSWASSAGNSRRTAIFANNTFLDGLFEWMDSPEGQQSIEVRDVLWNLVEDVQLDAKQRKLIWPDAEIARSRAIHSTHPEKVPGLSPATRSRSSYLTWIDMGYDPEKYSRRNSTNLTASQSDGRRPSPKGKSLKKNTRELVTLEVLTNDPYRRRFHMKKTALVCRIRSWLRECEGMGSIETCMQHGDGRTAGQLSPSRHTTCAGRGQNGEAKNAKAAVRR